MTMMHYHRRTRPSREGQRVCLRSPDCSRTCRLLDPLRSQPAQEFARGGWSCQGPGGWCLTCQQPNLAITPPNHMYNWCDIRGGIWPACHWLTQFPLHRPWFRSVLCCGGSRFTVESTYTMVQWFQSSTRKSDDKRQKKIGGKEN